MNKVNWIQSDFTRHVLTLMTGTTIAQAIPVAISPILTRLYTPDDFGVLSLFMSMALVFGSIANGRYELAIVLPDEDEDALNIVALSILIASGLSLFLFLLVLIFHDALVELLNNTGIGPWLYVVPVVVFLIGLFNALNYYRTRIKSFSVIAQASVAKALTSAIIQLTLGLFKYGAAGLISGNIFSHLSANIRLGYKMFGKVQQKAVSFDKIKKMAARFIDFPRFSMWATLANTLSVNLVNILISALYSITTLGHYALLNRVLGMPANLISKSVSQVYFQQASQERREKGTALATFDSTTRKMLAVSFVVFFILYFTVETIFVFVFGQEWRVAGSYAQIVMPLFLVRFVISPVSVTCSVFEKQRTALVWQVGLFIFSLLSFVVARLLDMPFENFLHIFTWTLVVYYFVFYFILRKIARNETLANGDL